MTLEERIEIAQNSLAAATTNEQRYLLGLGIQKLKDLIAEEKKSAEPSVNQGQLPDVEQRREQENKAAFFQERREKRLPTKEELQAWGQGMEKDNQNQHRDQTESAQAFEANRVVVGTITEAPVITVLVVEIALSGGAKKMNRVEIMNMLKTWFKRVATSKAMEKGLFSDAYGGAMGQDTYRLFQGWNTIYNETQEGAAWPPLEDVFPGLGRASQTQKVNAEILWRWASNDK